MGQIIGRTAKPDACNLRSLSSFGTPAAGQHILVSTDNSAMQNGQGNFDAYVVGDGTTAAAALPLHKINADIFAILDGKVDKVIEVWSEKSGNMKDLITAGNGFQNANGVVANPADTNWFTTDYVEVKQGSTITVQSLGGQGTAVMTVGFFDENHSCIVADSLCQYISSSVSVVVSNPLIKYVRFSGNAATYNTGQAKVTMEMKEESIDVLGLLFQLPVKDAELESDMETLETNVYAAIDGKADDAIAEWEEVSGKMKDLITAGNGYQNSSGVVANPSDTNWFTTDYVEVKQGSTIIVNALGGQGSSVMTVGFFDENHSCIVSESLCQYISSPVSVVVSNRLIKYVRFSGGAATYNAGQATVTMEMKSVKTIAEAIGELDAKDEILSARIDSVSSRIGVTTKYAASGTSIAEGAYRALYMPDIKNNRVLSYRVNVETMGVLRFGTGYANYGSILFEISATEIKEYQVINGENLIATFTHGMSISNYLAVTILVKYNDVADVIFSTDGGAYVIKDCLFTGVAGNMDVGNISGQYGNYEMKFFSEEPNKKLWAMGDSYLDYWGAFLIGNGVRSFMSDGYPGRNSSDALRSFKKEIETYTPQEVFWCVGMNDADSSSAINASWQSCADEFISICEEKGITPIFSTIPNTPTRNHTFKNTYIKNSGYKYIDVANAVGAESAGSSWTTGLLSADQVHPTDLGTKVIANAIVNGIPEMFNYDINMFVSQSN